MASVKNRQVETKNTRLVAHVTYKSHKDHRNSSKMWYFFHACGVQIWEGEHEILSPSLLSLWWQHKMGGRPGDLQAIQIQMRLKTTWEACSVFPKALIHFGILENLLLGPSLWSP